MQEGQVTFSTLRVACTEISGSFMESERGGAGNERAGDRRCARGTAGTSEYGGISGIKAGVWILKKKKTP